MMTLRRVLNHKKHTHKERRENNFFVNFAHTFADFALKHFDVLSYNR